LREACEAEPGANAKSRPCSLHPIWPGDASNPPISCVRWAPRLFED